MVFIETRLKDAYIIGLEPIEDERGFFARSWCKNEFEKHDLNSQLVQCNVSFNKNKGTLRGMHYQAKPNEEAKLIRCTRGSIYDVIIDLRPDSQTYREWESFELSEGNYQMIFIPQGFAHGFQTLEDNTEIFYQMTEFYHQESARGIRWDDPAFNIIWPLSNIIISERDKKYPFFIL
jgi:dTDP-4-dehydrorhamnose 3,5-epimerase